MAILADINKLSAVILALLGRQVLYASVVFVVIALLIRLFRVRSSYWHLGLWALVLVRLVLPPDLSSPISGRALLERIIPFEYACERLITWLSPARFALPEAGDVPRQEPPAPEDSVARPHPSWQTIGLACWILGMGGCLEVFWRKRSRYRKLMRAAQPVCNPDILALLRDCCGQFGIRRPVQLVSSDQNVSPFTYGIFRPAIYIPQRLMKAQSLRTPNRTALYAIIAHEVSHIKRHDVLWMSLQNVVQIIYFFFPVVWYTNYQIELARECICDRNAVSTGKISPSQYGSSLLTVLKLSFHTPQEPLQFLPSFHAHYRSLKQRIQQLTADGLPKKPRLRMMYASLLVCALVTLPMAPEVRKIKFFTPFDEAERHMYPTLQQRLVKPYAEAYSPTMPTMRYTGIGLQAEFGETVYAIGKGEVVRMTGDAPHTEVVIAHKLSRCTTVFSVYARITDVRVQVGDDVTEHTPIARLLTREEYDQSGLAEHHLHLEVRHTLNAYHSRSPHYFKYQTPQTLEAGFLNPLAFYRKHLQG